MWRQGSVEAAVAGVARGGRAVVRGARSVDTGADRGARGAASRTQAVSAISIVGGELHAERVPLSEVAARFGTPCYVYSRAALEAAFRVFDAAFEDTPHLVCYAVKANSNLAVLNILARLGSGFDIVSGGELARVLAAGGDPARIVFSGVGKTAAEMQAALAAGIRCFNVESASELEALNALAGRAGRVAPISLRVNPDVDPGTHPYIATGLKESKFGVAFADALELYRRASDLPFVDVRGIDCHIGSQITDLSACVEAAEKCSDSSIGSRPTESRCVTSTWAEVSVSAIATRRRSIRTPMRSLSAGRWDRGGRNSCSSRAGSSSARPACY
jgi:hypothetical protein